MRPAKLLWVWLLVTSLCLSCTCGDDADQNNTIGVQYRVTVNTLVISQVRYRQTDGSTVKEYPSHGIQQWHTTEFIDKDFAAELEVTFINNSQDNEDYTLRLFVNGQLKAVESGTIAPGTTQDAELSFKVDR